MRIYSEHYDKSALRVTTCRCSSGIGVEPYSYTCMCQHLWF